MKNNKGVTITSLTIYIIVATIIVGILTFLNVQFFSNISELTKESNIQNKDLDFKAAFIKDLKGQVSVSDFSNNLVKLSNGVTYEIRKAQDSNEGEAKYAVYRNDVKISDQVVAYKPTPIVTNPFFYYDRDNNVIYTSWQYSNSDNTYIENFSYKVGAVKGDVVAYLSEDDYSGSLETIEITFYSNFDEDYTYTQYIALGTGTPTIPVEIFVRNGYVIDGYSTDPDGEVEFYEGDEIDGSVTSFYAIWIAASRESVYLAGTGGGDFKTAVKTIPGVNNDLSKIKRFRWSTKSAYKNNADNAINVAASGNPIYAWFDSATGTVNLYSISTNIKLNVNCKDMFSGFTGLTDLSMRNDLKITDTEQVTNCEAMFRNCTALKTLDLNSFSPINVKNMKQMFDNCSNLQTLNLSTFSTSACETFEETFNNCSKLQNVDFSHLDTSSAKTFLRMFRNCASLTSLDCSNFNTTQVTNMQQFASGCEGLTSINLSGFSTEQVTNFYWMFNNCNKLVTMDLTSFNTVSGTNFEGMFTKCSSLKTIYASSDFVVNSSAASANMFTDARRIVGGNGTVYNRNHVNGTYAWIDGTDDKPGYFTRSMVGQDIILVYDYNDGTGTKRTLSYNYGDTIVIPGAPYNRADYMFLGWSTTPSGQKEYTEDMLYVGESTTLYALWDTSRYEYHGQLEFDGTNQIDTNIRLFSVENASKDFEIYFTIDDFASENVTQASIVSCKDENSNGQANYPYYGITIRIEKSGNNWKYKVSANSIVMGEYNHSFDVHAGGDKFHLLRIDGILYISINDAPFVQAVDFNTFTNYFDTPVTIGSSIGPDFNYFRNFIGRVSDVYISIGEDLDLNDFSVVAGLDTLPIVYQLTSKTFNGSSDYIDTGIRLFNTTNKSKDFMISFTIDNATYSNQGTVIADQGLANPYPGFRMRFSNSTQFQVAGLGGRNVNSPTINNSPGLKVNLYRKSNRLYVEFNDDQNYIQVHDFTTYAGNHDKPVIFGCAEDATQGRFRFFKGTLSDIVIRLDR